MDPLVHFDTIINHLKKNGFKMNDKDFDPGKPVAKELNEIRKLSGEECYTFFKEVLERGHLSEDYHYKGYDSLLDRFHPKIPIGRLIAIRGLLLEKQTSEQDQVLTGILNERISFFNQKVSRAINPKKELKIENFTRYFDNISPEKTYLNCSLDQIAILAKEYPADNQGSEVIVESLNSKIDDVLRQWLTRKTQADSITDTVIFNVQKKIRETLANYDPGQPFTPFIKTVIVRRFYDEHNRKIMQPFYEKPGGMDPDEGSPAREIPDSGPGDEKAVYLRVSFITITLCLFVRTAFKPHQKLIFTESNMFHTGNKTKKITLETFMNDNSDKNLYQLWKRVLARILAICAELDTITGHLFLKDYWEYTKSVPSQFDGFKQTLDSLFVRVYSETDYQKLKELFREYKTGEMKVMSFLPGEMKEIQHLIANWNTRIKNELRNPGNKKKSENNCTAECND